MNGKVAVGIVLCFLAMAGYGESTSADKNRTKPNMNNYLYRVPVDEQTEDSDTIKYVPYHAEQFNDSTTIIRERLVPKRQPARGRSSRGGHESLMETVFFAEVIICISAVLTVLFVIAFLIQCSQRFHNEEEIDDQSPLITGESVPPTSEPQPGPSRVEQMEIAESSV